MRGLHKSKRVSWASDLDLCQDFEDLVVIDTPNYNLIVRLFLSEESPSQVGLNSQDHLQAKTSLLLHPGGASSDDILPPGFEGPHASSQFEIKLSQIPVISWINPPKIMLNLTWQVVAGEESKEAEDQHRREMRVLEAIYPRPSSIPPNPSVDVEASHCMDDQTTLIPITPIEDEDAATDALSDSSMAPSNSFELPPGVPNGPNSHGSGQLAHGAISAASIALNNMMKSNEHGNMIDHELLNNILKNPEVIEKLVKDYGAANNNLQSAHTAGLSSAAFSHPSLPVNHGEASAPSSVAFLATSSHPPPIGGQVGPVSSHWLPKPVGSPAPISSTEVSLPKDVNYYKSLIQQHGEERQEQLPYPGNRQIQQRPMINHETPHNSRPRESKPKIMKPCIFFNSSRGCRNGANCAYQHDATFQSRGGAVQGIQSSKRMKMDSEISS